MLVATKSKCKTVKCIIYTRRIIGIIKYVEIIQYVFPKMFEYQRTEFISPKSLKFSIFFFLDNTTYNRNIIYKIIYYDLIIYYSTFLTPICMKMIVTKQKLKVNILWWLIWLYIYYFFSVRDLYIYQHFKYISNLYIICYFILNNNMVCSYQII